MKSVSLGGLAMDALHLLGHQGKSVS